MEAEQTAVKVAEVSEQAAYYYPPTEAPMMETNSSTELLMPPQETPATYTLEQVNTLLRMERENL
jgi:hypothetical protein